MTDEPTHQRADSADWWDHRPIFSVNDKGSRITGLAPGQVPGTLTTDLTITAVLCFATWGALSLFGSSFLCSGTSMPDSTCAVGVSDAWLIALVVMSLGLAVVVTIKLAEQARARFGQPRAASLLWMSALLAGIAVGGCTALALELTDEPTDRIRRTFDFEIGTEALFISLLVTAVATLWGLTTMARLPCALHDAHAQQARIERLRDQGARSVGTLRLGRIIYWLGPNPELEVTVLCDTPAGARGISARMRTSPDRVPANGSSVIVLGDAGDEVHLELDSDTETVFEPEEHYTASE